MPNIDEMPAGRTALGRQALDLALRTIRHWEMLNRTPVTHLDLLLGRVTHGVAFDEIDSCLARLKAVCPQFGDHPFTGGAYGDDYTLDAARAHLKEVLALVEPLRPRSVEPSKEGRRR